ncbi:unnamed protein product [Lampetra fluviatilis]
MRLRKHQFLKSQIASLCGSHGRRRGTTLSERLLAVYTTVVCRYSDAHSGAWPQFLLRRAGAKEERLPAIQRPLFQLFLPA